MITKNKAKLVNSVKNQKKMVGKITWIVLLFLLLSETVLSQNIYKWTDDKGIVQFGDNPPEGVKIEIVETGNSSEYKQERLHQKIYKPTGSGQIIKETGNSNSESASCLSAKKHVKNIKSMLRQPHSAKTGDNLKKRLKRANSSVRKLC